MNLKLLYLSMLMFVGCAPKILLLQSPVVSMTKSSLPDRTKAVEAGAIKEKWCTDEKPIKDDDGDQNYGFIDQVTYKAHRVHKDADFFLNSRYWVQGKGIFSGHVCVSLEASKAKIVRK